MEKFQEITSLKGNMHKKNKKKHVKRKRQREREREREKNGIFFFNATQRTFKVTDNPVQLMMNIQRQIAEA